MERTEGHGTLLFSNHLSQSSIQIGDTGYYNMNEILRENEVINYIYYKNLLTWMCEDGEDEKDFDWHVISLCPPTQHSASLLHFLIEPIKILGLNPWLNKKKFLCRIKNSDYLMNDDDEWEGRFGFWTPISFQKVWKRGWRIWWFFCKLEWFTRVSRSLAELEWESPCPVTEWNPSFPSDPNL